MERGVNVNLCTKMGESLLYVASENGHGSIVELSIARGANVDLCTEKDESHLFVRCDKGHASIVKKNYLTITLIYVTKTAKLLMV